MSEQDLLSIVGVLTQKTSNNEVSWEKYEEANPNAFAYNGKIKKTEEQVESIINVQFVLDKYESKNRGEVVTTCVNFAIINSDGSLIAEFVRCNGMFTNSESHLVEMQEFDLLLEFYNVVKANFEHFNNAIIDLAITA